MINDIIYNKNCLYIVLTGNIEKKIINKLKRQLYYILGEYNISNIIINIDKITKIDRDYFYDFLNDYISYGGNLTVKKK